MTELPDSNEALRDLCEGARLLREKFLKDPHRPGYHFVIPEGVHAPADPNGALYWNGRYHLCYIYQQGGKHYWGHISSRDLLHWRHHAPALSPDDSDEGIFSGGAFVDQNGVATITYWRLGAPDGIAIATSVHPHLEYWAKNPANPVIASTQLGLAERDGALYGSADPSQIWFEDGRYYMLTGNLLVLREFGQKREMPEHLGDTLYLFASEDLTHWTYLHPFYESKREWTFEFEDNMCADFFALPASPEGGAMSGKHMLLFISHTLGCQYYIGEYRDQHFFPEKHGRMSWPPEPEQHRGAMFYDHGYFAPESLMDERGRRIMWAWLFDHRAQETKLASGWSGEISLPRLLWLGEDGELHMRPADELANLRYGEKRLADRTVSAGEVVWLPEISGDSLEIAVTLRPNGAAQCGVRVRCSPDGAEQTAILYNAEKGVLQVDTRSSSLGEGRKEIETAPFSLREGEDLNLRIFLDKSILEVYANERQGMVRRIYPTRSDSQGVALFSEGGDVLASEMRAWEMMPSNPY